MRDMKQVTDRRIFFFFFSRNEVNKSEAIKICKPDSVPVSRRQIAYSSLDLPSRHKNCFNSVYNVFLICAEHIDA